MQIEGMNREKHSYRRRVFYFPPPSRSDVPTTQHLIIISCIIIFLRPNKLLARSNPRSIYIHFLHPRIRLFLSSYSFSLYLLYYLWQLSFERL